MRIALLLLVATAVMAQDGPKKPEGPPRKGDAVVVKGCVRGGAVESTSIARPDGPEHPTEPLTYRLTGDKQVLKTLKEDHDGHVDAIAAELRTNLPSTTGGARLGGSRIAVGVGASRGMMPEPPPPVPVLKVTAFEHTGVTCR